MSLLSFGFLAKPHRRQQQSYAARVLTIQPSALQALFALDEISTQLPLDSSGKDRNITVNVGPIEENNRVFVDGTRAAGFRPEGVYYLQNTNASLLTAIGNQSEITYAVWARINNSAGANSTWNDSFTYNLWLTLNHDATVGVTVGKGPTPNTLRISYSDGVHTVNTDNNIGAPGDTWHSVITTISKGNNRVRLYFDGVLQANVGNVSAVVPPVGNSGSVYIGKTPGVSWMGWMKYAAIWNIELQQADVTTYNTITAKSAITTNKLIVFDGDSLSTDAGLLVGQGWCKQTMAALGTTGWDYYYFGSAGGLTAQLLRYITLDVVSLYSAARAKNIYWVWIGTNDIKGGIDPTVVYNNIKSLCITAKTAGFHVGVSNIIPRSDVTGSHETNRQTLNASLASDHSFADAFADLNSQPHLQTPGDTTYFQVGGVHLTQAGYAVVSSICEPLIAAL